MNRRFSMSVPLIVLVSLTNSLDLPIAGAAENRDFSGSVDIGSGRKFTRVCACDRPGTPVGDKPSRSDAVPQPTTAKDAVADLHALLNAAGKVAPYVIVTLPIALFIISACAC
jgi:hypothetical protein